jgi:alcohol dehydrogenase
MSGAARRPRARIASEPALKAALFHQHGDLENLVYQDIADPEPLPDECLIRVKAVALNGFDPMILRGIPGLRTPLPMVPGADIAGEIVARGADVDAARWRIGERVLVIPNRFRDGKMVGMMGETMRGGASDFVAVPQDHLLPIPDAVTHVQAACLPVAYGTALRMMATRGKVTASEKVLILGASGGVGTCCVQLAKAAGAEVVACTSSERKAALLKALGADHVVNTEMQDYVQEVIRLYGKPRIWGGGGVDMIVNYTGGETWAQCFRALTRHGRLLTCGATAGYDPKTDIRYIWSFEFDIIGSNGWERSDIIELLDMVAQRRIEPVVDSVRPLAEIRAAMRRLIDREVFGKAVLIP